VLEQTELQPPEERARYVQLFRHYMETPSRQTPNAERLKAWLVVSEQLLSRGLAPVGMLRLAHSVVRQPYIWQQLFQPEETARVRGAIERAAFDWYGMAPDVELYDLRFTAIMVASYLNERTALSTESAGSRPLAQQRARQLIELLPTRHRNEWVQNHLPVAVQRQIAVAEASVRSHRVRDSLRALAVKARVHYDGDND
jgi:hypothetical protein